MGFVNFGLSPRAQSYLNKINPDDIICTESHGDTFLSLSFSTPIYEFNEDDRLFMRYDKLQEISIGGELDLRILVQRVLVKTQPCAWPFGFLTSTTHIFFLSIARAPGREWIKGLSWTEDEIDRELKQLLAKK